MSFCWDRFLIEGDELFNSMITEFHDMFNTNMTVKHYCIRNEGVYDHGSKEVGEQYDDDIQKELVPWIQNEFKSGRLFTKTLWKPFRDCCAPLHMYLGYKVMFTFKHYYFQLILDSGCYSKMCKYCDGNENNNVHFELVLYGWKDETSEKLQPYTIDPIPLNNMLPERFWRSK
jgi:hypothetical protein